VESLKEEMLVMRRPDELVQDEMSRVQADNRRLVHMLERTAEFKRLMDDMSELKDVHYIPLNECLVEEDLISYPYLPVSVCGGLRVVATRQLPYLLRVWRNPTQVKANQHARQPAATGEGMLAHAHEKTGTEMMM
jgi:hypothetical protein